MSGKSLVDEMLQVQMAIELIELGARLQVLETEIPLSRGRLLRLYKEVRGESPPKGMLPFSTDWFVTWQPSLHASLFYNIYLQMTQGQGCERMEGFIKAFRLYLEQVELGDLEQVLGLTRAWTLVRYFESHVFEMVPCSRCRLPFVCYQHTPSEGFVCGLCQPPPRAGCIRRVVQA